MCLWRRSHARDVDGPDQHPADPGEHRSWTATAKARGLSLAEFIRRSVVAAEDAPSAAELDELELLAAELTAASATMHRAVDEAIAQVRQSSDPAWEAAVRARVAAELAASPVVLDPAILDFAVA